MPVEGLGEASGVDPPEVVEVAVDEDDGHLIGVGSQEAQVVGGVDVDGVEGLPGGGAGVPDDGDGLVTQVATGACEDADTGFGVRLGHVRQSACPGACIGTPGRPEAPLPAFAGSSASRG